MELSWKRHHSEYSQKIPQRLRELIYGSNCAVKPTRLRRSAYFRSLGLAKFISAPPHLFAPRHYADLKSPKVEPLENRQNSTNSCRRTLRRLVAADKWTEAVSARFHNQADHRPYYHENLYAIRRQRGNTVQFTRTREESEGLSARTKAELRSA